MDAAQSSANRERPQLDPVFVFWLVALFVITGLGALPLFFYRIDMSKLTFSSPIQSPDGGLASPGISLRYSAHPCFSSWAISFVLDLVWHFRHTGWLFPGRRRLRSYWGP